MQGSYDVITVRLSVRKFGKFGQQKIQPYRCKQCKKIFSEASEKPVQPQGPLGMRISLDKAENILKLMLDECQCVTSSRSTAKIK